MDSSDIEDNMKDNEPTEKRKNQKDPKILDEKICQENELMHDIPVNSSVLQKSQPCFQEQQKLSTDVKISVKDLTDCANKEDTDFTTHYSKKHKKPLSPVSFPCNKKEFIQIGKYQADQFITGEKRLMSKEFNSASYDINGSMKFVNSSTLHQCESDLFQGLQLDKFVETVNNGITNIVQNLVGNLFNKPIVTSDKPMSENIDDSKYSAVGISSKDDTKVIDKNLLENETLSDNIPPTFGEREKNCPKFKEDRLRYPRKFLPEISPKKGKSEQIAEDDIKQKRSAGNTLIEGRIDENLTDSLNERNSELHGDYCEKHLENTVISNGMTERCIEEQSIANQMDRSDVKDKITETTHETDYELHEIQTSNNASSSDQTRSSDSVLLLENSNINSSENRSVSFAECSLFSPLIDHVRENGINNPPNETRDKSTSENKLKDSKNELADTNNFKNPVVELSREMENTLVRFSNKMTNVKLSCDTTIEITQSSADMGKFEVSNVSKNREHTPPLEPLPRQDEIIREHSYRRNSRFSPLNFRIPECNLNPIYNEPEQKFINLEFLENDPEFIANQKQILESISERQAVSTLLSLNPESDDKLKIPEPLKSKSSPEVPLESLIIVYVLVDVLDDALKTQGLNVDSIDKSPLIYFLKYFSEIHYPPAIPHIPYIVTNYWEYMRKAHRQLKIVHDGSINDTLENNIALNPSASVDHSLGKLSAIVNALSQIPLTPKNEQDKISEADSPEFREYPGLAGDLKNVKKDARYQKKFYKEKQPVILRKTWSGDKASFSKIIPNVDSKKSQMQINGDHPRIEPRIKDSVNEVSGDPDISLEDKDVLKKQSEDTHSVEELIQVKKDQRCQKRVCGENPVILAKKWKGDEDSFFEIEPNIDSNKKQMQIIGDDPQMVPRISVDEEISEKDGKFLSKDNGMCKEKRIS